MTDSLSPLAYQLYGRQMILPELGQAGQRKIMDATVAVIGAGGLGAPALLYLAGAGVGRVLIIDDDTVEPSNLHRQVIHSYSRVGASKADSAAQSMRELNPLITVDTAKIRLTDANAAELLAGVDVLVDGSDNFPTRYTASRAAAALGIPHVWGAILGFDAQMSVFWAGHGPRYEDLYPVEPEPGSVPNCATAGVIGALAGVVGTSMALETIKLITGVGTPLTGQVGYYTGLEGRWEYIPLLAGTAPVPEPAQTTPPVEDDGGEGRLEQPATPAQPALRVSTTLGEPLPSKLASAEPAGAEPDQFGIDITFDDFDTSPYFAGVPLIDVREAHEHEALAIPGSAHLPLSLLEQAAEEGRLSQMVEEFLPNRRGRYALYCATGVRSRAAANLLLGAGYHDVYSLEGGISSWLNRR